MVSKKQIIRIFDLFLSTMGIFVLMPLILLGVILSWFDTKAPFFFQKRIGYLKKEFLIIKLRTMKINTKNMPTHLVDTNALSNIGRFLRKTKIDEIPQLLNVLKGDMSLVGPRPCLFNQRRLIGERKKRGVFKARPGITGLAQISGITMKTPSLLAKTDQKMIKNMSLYNYFYYIFKTIFKIIK